MSELEREQGDTLLVSDHATPSAPVLSGNGARRYAVSIDVGGTFTDFVLVDLASERPPIFHKILTTPAAPAHAVIAGWRALLGKAGITAADIDSVVHGTTLVTNAIVEWRGAHGYHVVVSTLPDYDGPVMLYVDPERMRFPAAGLAGGEDAPLATFARNGVNLTIDDLAAGQIQLDSPADGVEMRLSGGAGYGPPAERDPAPTEQDVRQDFRST